MTGYRSRVDVRPHVWSVCPLFRWDRGWRGCFAGHATLRRYQDKDATLPGQVYFGEACGSVRIPGMCKTGSE